MQPCGRGRIHGSHVKAKNLKNTCRRRRSRHEKRPHSHSGYTQPRPINGFLSHEFGSFTVYWVLTLAKADRRDSGGVFLPGINEMERAPMRMTNFFNASIAVTLFASTATLAQFTYPDCDPL
jgi:hypothetical protein